MDDYTKALVSAFKRYLPERVVEKIMTDPRSVRVEGERRVVTILFGDISGFTSLSEKLDPEEVVQIINQYFCRMLDIIEKYGGDVDKFLGDAVLVVFGAPVAHSDDPERAVRAALEMQEVMSQFPSVMAKGEEIPIRMSIGINTGEVVALNMGSDRRMEYTVMGDNVNLASRLEGVAQAGEIIISHNTYKYVKDVFDLEKLPPVKVKGKAKPIQIYKVKGVKREAKIVRREIPLVGRKREIETISQFLDKVALGEKGVVGILGRSGVGKTRLLNEAIDVGKQKGFGTVVLEGVSYGKGLILHPLVEFTTRYFGIIPSDTPEAVIKKLTVPADVRLGFEVLLSLPSGEAVPPEHKKPLITNGFRYLFSSMAVEKPLLIAVDDLQWMDDDTVEILSSLVADEELTGVGFLVTSMDEGMPFPVEKQIELAPLSRGEVENMISLLFGGDVEIDSAIIDLVMRRTEGVPLFVGELVHTLRRRKVLRHKDGRIVPTKRFSSIKLPDTVRGVILERLDAIPESAKRLVQYASVIGRDLEEEILVEAFNLDPHRLKEDLTLLVEEGLIIRRVGMELSHQLASNTLQEVAYETLLKGRRQEFHSRVGFAMERLYSARLPEHYDALAYHFDRSKEVEKAVEYLMKAGDRARLLFANSAALHFYSRLAEYRRKGLPQDMLVSCYIRRGAVYRHIGMRDEALRDYRRALRLANKLQDPRMVMTVLVNIGVVWDMMGDADRARRYYRRVLSLAKKHKMPDFESLAYQNLGNLAKKEGRIQSALSFYENAMDVQKKAGNERAVGDLLYSMAQVYEHSGDIERAREYYQRSLDLRESIDDKPGMIMSLSALGIVHSIAGEIDEAELLHNRALTLAREIEDRDGEARALLNLGIIAATRGDMQSARSWFEDSYRLRERMGDPHGMGECMVNIGDVYTREGNFPEALKAHHKARELARSAKDLFLLTYAALGEAEDLIQMAMYGDAYPLTEGILKQAEAMGDPVFIANACRVRGKLFTLLGERKLAEEYLQRSREIGREVPNAELHSKIISALAEFYLTFGMPDDARDMGEKLLILGERVGDPFFITQGKGILARGWKLAGDIDKMSQYITEAFESSMELNNRLLSAWMLLEIAGFYFDVEDYTSAVDSARQAVALMKEMGVKEGEWKAHFLIGEIMMREGHGDLGYESFVKSTDVLREIFLCLPTEYTDKFLGVLGRGDVFREALNYLLQKRDFTLAQQFIQSYPPEIVIPMLKSLSPEDRLAKGFLGKLLMFAESLN